MSQIFEKVHSKSKSKPKFFTAFEKSKTFMERGFTKKNNVKDENESEVLSDNFYVNNQYLSIITDTVLGEDYNKYFKQFSELESFEPLSSKALRKNKVKRNIVNSVDKTDSGSVHVEEIDEESNEEIGCGLYFKIKREIIKSFRNKIDPRAR